MTKRSAGASGNGRRIRVFPESVGSLLRTLMWCAIIVIGFIAVFGGILALYYIVTGTNL
jgi:hypothetical protein